MENGINATVACNCGVWLLYLFSDTNQPPPHFMKTTDLLFVGIKGSVIALNRATGQQIWATHLRGSDFVNVVFQDGAVLASCYGEIFCLDPLTGNARWHNPLKGFGIGLATIAADNPGTGNVPLLAAKRRLDQETATAGATAAT